MTKEAAFVRALSIATLAHTIAIACGENFTTCYRPATVPPTKDEKGHLTYQGYAENITYGLEIAKEFFETYEQSKSYIGDKGYVILHNYRAGRMVRGCDRAMLFIATIVNQLSIVACWSLL